ncbi:MAG: pantoate--beta-alanine ligase [Planctomycetes bacterium]|nr:pantoate--beta-alanine ligase [Planctomycetota bacterium]
MEIVKTIKEIRAAVSAGRADGKRIGLVPTMGALHAGHVSLIDRAVADCDFVVVSIFVNPAQFGPNEDFDKYPRDLDADAKVCEDAGADVIFAPSAGEMYPLANCTWVDVEGITDHLCGASRAGHFRGVTTVCTKLFNIVCPDQAFFGQKDAQQAIVIKRMVADLNMPLEIVVCPTVRQEDGLALSSRNKYLTDAELKDALLISKSLKVCARAIAGGEIDSEKLIGLMKSIISGGGVDIEYLSIVDTQTLENVSKVEGQVLVAIAGRVGKTRLIDNIFVDLNK